MVAVERGALTVLETLATALLAAVSLAALPAYAQDEVPDPRVVKLAEEFSDPLTTLPQVFTQDAYTPANYGTGAPANRVIARLIVPRIPKYSLLPFVQLVRPSFSLVTVPTGRGGATQTAFGDMQLLDLGVIPWPGRETGLLMAVGPVFVFPTATGVPVKYIHFLTEIWRPTLKKAGLAARKYHSTRHSYAAWSLSAKVDLRVVSEALGHASVKLTLDTYARHVSVEQREQAGRLLDAWLDAK